MTHIPFIRQKKEEDIGKGNHSPHHPRREKRQGVWSLFSRRKGGEGQSGTVHLHKGPKGKRVPTYIYFLRGKRKKKKKKAEKKEKGEKSLDLVLPAELERKVVFFPKER